MPGGTSLTALWLSDTLAREAGITQELALQVLDALIYIMTLSDLQTLAMDVGLDGKWLDAELDFYGYEFKPGGTYDSDRIVKKQAKKS